jgi:hypothetical protein
MGGNAVLGYSFALDTEGVTAVIARACGTACRLLKVDTSSGAMVDIPRAKYASITAGLPEWQNLLKMVGKTAVISRDHAEVLVPKLFRSASSSVKAMRVEPFILLKAVDDVTITATQLLPFSLPHDKNTREALPSGRPGNKLDSERLGSGGNAAENTNNIFHNEVQLITMTSFPSHVSVKYGGLVLARSVKFIGGKGETSISEEVTKDEWWKELREEIKSHATSLCCRFVIGYSESCTIHGDVCILSAIGTAAQVKGLVHAIAANNLPSLDAVVSSTPPTPFMKDFSLSSVNNLNTVSSTMSLDMMGFHSNGSSVIDSDMHSLSLSPSPVPCQYHTGKTPLLSETAGIDSNSSPPNLTRGESIEIRSSSPLMFSQSPPQAPFKSNDTCLLKKKLKSHCGASHVPYNHNTAPFAFMRLVPCLLCRRKWVPETILSTTELPIDLTVRGKGRLLEAKVCRVRKPSTGEADAVKISEILPFLEYDVQRQIVLKLKVMGMNSAFGYSCKVHVSNEVVIATAFCTAVYLEALPPPVILQIARHNSSIPAGNHHAQHANNNTHDDDHRLNNLQKQIEQLMQSNREMLMLTERGGDMTMTSVGPKFGKHLEIDDADDSDSSHSSTSSSSSSSSNEDSSSGDSSSLESPSSSESDTSSSDDEVDDNEKLNEDVVGRTRSGTYGSKRSAEGSTIDGKLTRRVRSSTRSVMKESVRTTSSTAKTTSLKKKLKKSVYQDDRQPYILEVDEETDADLNAVLKDYVVPNGFDMVNLSVSVVFS